MNTDDVLANIRLALKKTLDSDVEIGLDTNLINEQILDSLDAMVFLMELEGITGVSFPEDLDPIEQKWFVIRDLVAYINTQS